MEAITKEQLFMIFLFLLLVVVLILYLKKILNYNKLFNRYSGLIRVEQEIERQKHLFKKLRADYENKRNIYEELLKEVSIVEEDLEFQSYGIYKPHFDFDTSTKYKLEIERIRTDQKRAIKEKAAVFCPTEWSVGGSRKEGQKMTDKYMKLMLRAFNNECDAAILKVKWNNVYNLEERIKRAYNAINKLGKIHNIEISEEFLSLKLDELSLSHEYQEKIYEEKEEQRRIREQMREEEKVRREIEQAKKEAENEEKRFQRALIEAKKQLEKATGEEITVLNDKISMLQRQLLEAEEKKERALSRAQLTKSGHVYVISNIGSFGQDIYKIGLTRRLEPLDRVKELGDASVPFTFDIHAMIYSENAPELENELHKTFAEKRVNLINNRKEFFRVTINQIEKAVLAGDNEIKFTKTAEAKEYHETLALRNAETDMRGVLNTVEKRFPATLI